MGLFTALAVTAAALASRKLGQKSAEAKFKQQQQATTSSSTIPGSRPAPTSTVLEEAANPQAPDVLQAASQASSAASQAATRARRRAVGGRNELKAGRGRNPQAILSPRTLIGS